MHIGHKSNTKYYLHNDGQGCEIAVSRLEKDLGIWVSDDLKWRIQCCKAAEKAMSVEESTSGRRCDSEREGYETKGEEVEVGRHNSGLHGQASSVDTDKVSSITFYYNNAQSLYHKIPELQKVIDYY